MPPRQKGKLTDKQKRFVQEYVIDSNATQAAIRAGYSERTAHSTGHDNVRKPEIKAAIDKALQKIGKKREITAEWIAAELQDNVSLAKMQKRPDVSAANSALNILSKYTGGFSDTQKLEGDITINVITRTEGTPGSKKESEGE